MASLRKQPTSKYWQALIREPVTDPVTGKVVKWKLVGRTTRETVKNRAIAKAVQMEASIRSKCGSGSDQSRKLLSILQEATELALQERLSEPQARKFIAELFAESRGEELECFTVESWLSEWLTQKESKVGAGTLALYRVATKTFVEWLGLRRDQRLETISRSDVIKFAEYVHRSGRTAKTANQYRKSIGNALKEAYHSGLLLVNPGEGVQALPEEDSVQREPFTGNEITALVKATADDAEWRTVILLGAYTGLRLTNCTKMKWADLDLEKGLIRVVPVKQRRMTKRKKQLKIPIHATLERALAGLLRPDDPEARLFPRLAQLPTGGTSGLDAEFRKIMAKAGVDRKLVRSLEQGHRKDVARKSFHSLRHAANTLMAEAGISQELRRRILGHASDEMNDGYTHLTDGSLKHAVDTLPEL